MKKQPILRVPTIADVKELLSNNNLRDKGVIMLLLNTGLRISELVRLDYEDVFYGDSIRNRISVVGKGQKERLIPLNEGAKEGIRLIHKNNLTIVKKSDISIHTPLILNYARKRISRNYLTTKIKDWADYCGIDMTVSAHTLRHTFVTYLIENNTNFKDIQTLVGHSDIRTTINIYGKSTTESLAKAVNGLKF